MARFTKAPRAPEAPRVRPTTGCQATRPEICRPSLSSSTRGFDSVPEVTDTAASMRWAA
jgi:hypothetical protein